MTLFQQGRECPGSTADIKRMIPGSKCGLIEQSAPGPIGAQQFCYQVVERQKHIVTRSGKIGSLRFAHLNYVSHRLFLSDLNIHSLMDTCSITILWFRSHHRENKRRVAVPFGTICLFLSGCKVEEYGN